jgi:hypothetical protein
MRVTFNGYPTIWFLRFHNDQNQLVLGCTTSADPICSHFKSYTHKSFKKIMGLGAISFEKHFSLKQFIEASGNRQRCMFLRCLLLSQQKIILHFTDITDFWEREKPKTKTKNIVFWADFTLCGPKFQDKCIPLTLPEQNHWYKGDAKKPKVELPIYLDAKG